MEPYDVRNYGAVCDGAHDDTNAIQETLARNPVALVPIGVTCNVAGIVAIGEGRTLLLGGRLHRVSGGAKTPLVVLQGHQSVLRGLAGTNSTITSSYDSPDGVVCVGQFTDGQPLKSRGGLAMIEPEVSNLRIVGNHGAASKGLALQSMQVHHDQNSWLYDGHFFNLYIRDVAIGIYLNSQANAHTFDRITFRNIGRYAVALIGDSEGAGQTNSDNLFNGVFVESSAGLAACIYGRAVSHTHFTNLGGEPGSGKLLDVEGTLLFASGMNNCPDASSWNVTQGILMLDGALTAASMNGTTVTAGQLHASSANVSGAVAAGTLNASWVTAARLNAANADLGRGSLTVGASVSKSVKPGGTAAIDVDFSDAGFCTIEVVVALASDPAKQAHFYMERVSCAGSAGGATPMQELHNASAGAFRVASSDFQLTRPALRRVRLAFVSRAGAAVTLTAFARGSRVAGMTVT